MPRAVLNEAQRRRIMAAKGFGDADEVAAAYGIKPAVVHNIWQGRIKGGHRVVTDEVREIIVSGKAAGRTNAELIKLSGFSECTIRQVLAGAREEGDMRAHSDPAIRARAARQRAAADAAHREGGGISPVAPAALPPNSMEASLIMRGMRPEVARQTAKAWRDRHARKNEARGR